MRLPPEARSKYHATATIIDGVRFMSKREASRYLTLKVQCQAGLISHLVLQPWFDLHVVDVSGSSRCIGRYVGDFEYVDADTGEVIVEDVKGMRLPLYRWKKRHVEAEYGFTIQEV